MAGSVSEGGGHWGTHMVGASDARTEYGSIRDYTAGALVGVVPGHNPKLC